jgi:hypothetical protein
MRSGKSVARSVIGDCGTARQPERIADKDAPPDLKAKRFGALKSLPPAPNVAHSHPASLAQRKVRDVASSIQPI